MSALALPSFIAPAQASAPQGSTGDADATGFKSLLTTALEKDAAPVEAEKPEPEPANDDADAAATIVMPVASAAPLPVPVPVVLPVASAVPPPIPGPVGLKAAPAAPPPVPGPVVLPVAPAPPLPVPGPVILPVAADEADTSAPAGAPTDVPTDAPAPAIDPSAMLLQTGQAQPPVAPRTEAPREKTQPLRTIEPVASDIPASDPPDPTISETVEVKAAAPARAEGATIHPPAQPAPPPLRALAERTSRPLDPQTDKAAGASGSGAAPSEARAGAASAIATPASPTGPDRTAAAPDGAPKPANAPVSSDEPAIEAAPSAENSTGSTATAAQTREVSLSGLSRATIDATAQIAAQILRKLEGRSTRFEMALTPDHLGRVDVKLDIDSEGRLAARLAFDNPLAATDLRGRVDDLRRELEDAGFHLADDAFEFAERDSGSSSFDRGQDARHGQNRAFAAASRLNAEIDVAQPPRWMALSLSPSGVDLKV